VLLSDPPPPTYARRPETAPAHILIVDDEPALQQTLARSLSTAGYTTHIAGRGATAIEVLHDHAPDLILLDLMLPDIDGLAVCRAMRAESALPIIVLSAVSDVAQQVALFDAGADDYLLKPAHRELLLARIRRALARPIVMISPAPTTYVLGDIQADLRQHCLWCGTQPIHLTPTEWALLVLLLQGHERVVSYFQISASLWPGEALHSHEAIHTVCKQLRRKLGDSVVITTVRELGYQLHPASCASPN
jgi:DNA-binding response OmpR family regulator